MKLLFLSIFYIPITCFLFLFCLHQIYASNQPNFSAMYNLPLPKTDVLGVLTSSQNPTVNVHIPSVDVRILILQKFFKNYNSPLLDVVDEIVQQSDLWGLDYALIPAIAMQESLGCKRIPPNSYNCWGYGIYADKVTRFDSYQSAIAQIAKTIKEAYIKMGYTNATLVEDRWTPSSKGQWSYSVNYFIGIIRQYERNITGS